MKNIKKILISTAMSEEYQAFLNVFNECSPKKIENKPFPQAVFHYNNYEFNVVQNGVGEVNSSLVASNILSLQPDTDLIISAGTCGGLAPLVEVGDVIIGENYYYGAVNATMIGYKLGQVPDMPASYGTSESVFQNIKKSASKLKYVAGTICTANIFYGEDEINKIKTWVPNLIAVDMESASLAQVAFRYGKEFIAIRSVSDLALNDGGESFDKQKVDASRISAEAVKEIFKNC